MVTRYSAWNTSPARWKEKVRLARETPTWAMVESFRPARYTTLPTKETGGPLVSRPIRLYTA